MRVVLLSGGVGGARMARGLAAVAGIDLAVVVNVGDDESVHGLHVSPDIDTVLYTLASIEGPEGWGRQGDTFTTNTELARFGVDNRFRLGDLDLALNIFRSWRLAAGDTLSEVTTAIATGLGVELPVVPATNDRLRTEVLVRGSDWISFQEYFVLRGNRDEVAQLRFAGAAEATPAPGVLEALARADVVVIAPSNPPLSIWPILAVPGVREAVAAHQKVTAVSPLFGGEALKGPAARVLSSLGLPGGNAGVAAAYEGVIDTLVVDRGDAADVGTIDGIEVVADDTLIGEGPAAARLARAILAR